MLKTDLSADAYERAKQVMPAGNTRTSNYETPRPIYLSSGEGAYITDVDGNRYLDFQNNFTALIHGYGHPRIKSALEAQLRQGVSFANPTLAEIELAELLCDRVAHFEHIRFTNTGSEAVMMAIKAARAVTGRKLIAKCEGAYHGNYDPVEVSVSSMPSAWQGGKAFSCPEHDGLVSSTLTDTVIIPFNDIENTDRVLAAAGSDLAAVLVDPLPSRIGLVAIDPDYLAYLRARTSALSALLISDEVLSFRLGFGGALGDGTIEPDLTAFGKIIGGGLPIGAVAGLADIMGVFAPSASDGPHVAHSGTFTANPLSMVAGHAALTELTRKEFERLNRLGDEARQALRAALSSACVIGAVTGAGSLFRVFLGRADIKDYADCHQASQAAPILRQVVGHMRERGVLISQIGLGALSTPMTSSNISLLSEAFEEALRVVADETEYHQKGRQQ